MAFLLPVSSRFTTRSLLLLTTFLIRLCAAQVEPTFESPPYPPGAQQCLYDSADTSQCSGDSGPELNSCLCGNGGSSGGFVYLTADCVGRESPDDLEGTYDAMAGRCNESATPLTVSRDEFIARGEAAQETPSSSSTIPSSTATPSRTRSQTPTSTITSNTGTTTTPATDSSTTSTASSTSSSTATGTGTPQPSESSSLSQGAKIGIGVGVAFGFIASLLAAWFIWAYSRRRVPVISYAQDEAMHSPADGEGSGEVKMPPGDPTKPQPPAFSSPAEWAQQNGQMERAELATTQSVLHFPLAPPPAELPAYGPDGPQRALSVSPLTGPLAGPPPTHTPPPPSASSAPTSPVALSRRLTSRFSSNGMPTSPYSPDSYHHRSLSNVSS